MTRIAIEATGCDKGFLTVLAGVSRAVEKDKTLELVLVAGKDNLPKDYYELSRIKGIHIEKTEFTYDSEGKKDNKKSSIYRAIEMHKSGGVDAVIAPGDTGATAFYSFKMLDRISKLRPAIACNFSSNVLIDAGANLICKPAYYVQYAIMGNVFSKFYLGIKNPLTGILTLATEISRGDDLAKHGRPLVDKLKDKGYRVSGEFFEPHSFRNPGKGFKRGLVGVTNAIIGNIMLKTAETCFEIEGDIIKEGFDGEPSWSRLLGAVPLKRIYDRLKKKIDYRSFAVAPLLGYEANVMICHGRSDAKAIENAILITDNYLKAKINDRLREEIERVK